MGKILTYTELITLPTFEERLQYLQLAGDVGKDTFGFDRYMNQMFYQSAEWKNIRTYVILRDNGCDLGLPGFEIAGRVIIHHINPLRVCDIKDVTDYLLNPEYLITTTHDTHNAIHYGSHALATTVPIDRKPNDTCPWKK